MLGSLDRVWDFKLMLCMRGARRVSIFRDVRFWKLGVYMLFMGFTV